jgi:hypothetical protein
LPQAVREFRASSCHSRDDAIVPFEHLALHPEDSTSVVRAPTVVGINSVTIWRTSPATSALQF